MKKFQGLAVSSKFAICGLPIRVDTYKTCAFNCAYCFANNRKIMEFEKELQIADIDSIQRRLDKITKNGARQVDFLDTLIERGITWHCGGMSDPFQPIERKFQITKQLIDVTAKHNVSILFSTKSDTVYDADIRPDLHAFQLSVTNLDNRKDLEPNVPDIDRRIKFFEQLKKNGFKVGIRIQPFIPNVTSIDIVDAFRGADHFTVEGLKIVPQNKEHKEFILKATGLDKSDFTQMGLLNLKPEIREKLYAPLVDKLQSIGASFSIADNDMHHIGNSLCCCGDALIKKATSFNNTSMIQIHGIGYAKEQLDDEIFFSGCRDCKCSHLFTSNRTEGCTSVQDFFDARFNRKSSPFSPKFLYKYEEISSAN